MTTTLPPKSIINVDPEILGGKPVFMGTRVPIYIFWDYLEGGYSMDEFLVQYPSVKREQCVGLVVAAREKVMPNACAA
ncbi:MAG: DUF433 domain-containing protein [Phycisphaerales bacterium]|nr:DUF433 domain-containing protein [Phycisphaerales bacterium]